MNVLSKHPARQRVAALFLFAGCVWLLWPQTVLKVADLETGEVYFLLPGEEGQTVRLSWTHSVERTPWVEEYIVEDGRFALREVRVKSFGAGVDVEAPTVETRRGWVVMRGMKRRDPILTFRYSVRAGYRLEIGGRPLDLKKRVKHHRPLVVQLSAYPRISIIMDGGGFLGAIPATRG